ncbi:MAG: hypothetical protein ACRC6I_01875 [Paracoccaceae bacterium]
MSEERIHWDLTSPLMDLSVVQLVRLANLAMNRLTMRDWGEIGHDIGVRIEMRMASKPEAPEDGDARDVEGETT